MCARPWACIFKSHCSITREVSEPSSTREETGRDVTCQRPPSWQMVVKLESIWTQHLPSWPSHWAALRKTLHRPQKDSLLLRQFFYGLARLGALFFCVKGQTGQIFTIPCRELQTGGAAESTQCGNESQAVATESGGQSPDRS